MNPSVSIALSFTDNWAFPDPIKPFLKLGFGVLNTTESKVGVLLNQMALVADEAAFTFCTVMPFSGRIFLFMAAIPALRVTSRYPGSTPEMSATR